MGRTVEPDYDSDVSVDMSVGLAKNGEYTVEQVLATKNLSNRSTGRKRYYLIKWKGWPSRYNTWEPIEHLSRAKLAVADYWKRIKDIRNKRVKAKVSTTNIPHDPRIKNKRRLSPMKAAPPPKRIPRLCRDECNKFSREVVRKRGRPRKKLGSEVSETSTGSTGSMSSSWLSSDEDDYEDYDDELLSNALSTIEVTEVVPTGKTLTKVFGVTFIYGSPAFLVQWNGECCLEVVSAGPLSKAFPDLIPRLRSGPY